MPVGLPDAGKLGLAVQLAHWRRHGAFPDEEADLVPMVVAHLAGQVGVSVEALDGYDWAGWTGRRHRRIVPDHLRHVRDLDMERRLDLEAARAA